MKEKETLYRYKSQQVNDTFVDIKLSPLDKEKCSLEYSVGLAGFGTRSVIVLTQDVWEKVGAAMGWK